MHTALIKQTALYSVIARFTLKSYQLCGGWVIYHKCQLFPKMELPIAKSATIGGNVVYIVDKWTLSLLLKQNLDSFSK